MNGVISSAVFALVVLVGCAGQAEVAEPSDSPAVDTEPSGRQDQALGQPDQAAPESTEPAPEPVPYIPAGRPGSAGDYAKLIERLEQDLPAELRGQAPWPDLRNPNPVAVQIEIFDLWLWMEMNYPETELVEVMAAPGSPSSEEIAGIFGEQKLRNELEFRTGDGYRAFDHVVVTFESAGLPLWLARDVPEDAVVVYYRDSSGPIEVFDRDSGSYITTTPGSSTRTWLSIMVPTNVGWQLWRDQILDASNGLQVPDVPPPPGDSEQERTPEL